MKAPADLRERTKQFALRVVRLFPALPKSGEAQVVGRQLLSVPCHIAAGTTRSRRASFRIANLLQTALQHFAVKEDAIASPLRCHQF